MQRVILSIALLATVALGVNAVNLQPFPAGVPPLYRVYQVNLPAVYGCGNYTTSALFVSQSGLQLNRPALLFQGYCGDSNPTWQINLAGDDFGVMTNLGSIPITKVSAQMTTDPKLVWQTSLPVQSGSTYAFLSTKGDTRALSVVQVTDFDKSSVSFYWAALQYEFTQITAGYGQFQWGATPKMPSL